MEIPIIKFACMNQLEIFWIKAKKQLIDEKNIVEVKYPKSLQHESNNFSENWDNQTDEIKRINLQIFNSISSKAGVYAIFSRNRSQDTWQIKYIGQTTEQFSMQRLTNHLIIKHKNTGAKLEHVKAAVESGKQVGFSFLQVEPAELRHFVEEKLISAHKEKLEWNQRSKK